MKRNRLFLLLMLILLSGCSCEYELTIDIANNDYKEQLSITGKNEKEKESLLKEDWVVDVDFNEYNEVDEEIVKLENNNYYDVKVIDNSLLLSYDHNISTMKKSTIALSCFKKVRLIRDTNKLYINTTNGLTCYDDYDNLENVKVIIKSNDKVISNNADKIEDNKYIWNFTRANKNKSINLVLESQEQKGTIISKTSSSVNNINNQLQFIERYAYYIFVAVLAIILVIGYIVYKKIKKQESE